MQVLRAFCAHFGSIGGDYRKVYGARSGILERGSIVNPMRPIRELYRQSENTYLYC